MQQTLPKLWLKPRFKTFQRSEIYLPKFRFKKFQRKIQRIVSYIVQRTNQSWYRNGNRKRKQKQDTKLVNTEEKPKHQKQKRVENLVMQLQPGSDWFTHCREWCDVVQWKHNQLRGPSEEGKPSLRPTGPNVLSP